MTEKLHKVLARCGFGSRRQMESMIAEGLVMVNGKVATLGDRVDSSARIEYEGRKIRLPRDEQRTRVILYSKPEGEICTRDDPEGRPTVYQALPNLVNGRWISIGRLDINTSGLLLFTNNGELANDLMHPRNQVEREYAVRIFGEVTPAMIQRLRKGVKLEDGFAKFNAISKGNGSGKNVWYNVVLTEGRQREVRRLWESQAVSVSRLIRIRFGDITLPRGLKTGQFIELEHHEIAALGHESDQDD